MADVYVARQQAAAGFDKIVALKFLRELGDNTDWVEMFLEEVRTTALLNHPCIVQTFDAGEIGDRLFMAMEFVNGETLGKFANVVSRATGSFPVELAVAIVRDVASALEHAHTLTNLAGTPLGIVHRDVSPSNILLSFEGMVKLLDFGVAKVSTKVQQTGAGVIKGKFSYMSPEQARGEPIDHRSDIYSLGIVLWQLLTGKRAFDGKSEAELFREITRPNLPPPSMAGSSCNPLLDEIVMNALAPAREDRYASAGDFSTCLARYLSRHASGFDSPKLLRALMAANFSERRERLAELIKQSELDMPRQQSIVTQMPGMSGVRTGTGSTSSVASIAPSVAIPVSLSPSRSRRGLPLALLVLGAAAGAGGYVAYRDHTAKPVQVAPVARDPAQAQIDKRIAELDARIKEQEHREQAASARVVADPVPAPVPVVVEPPAPMVEPVATARGTKRVPPPPRVAAAKPGTKPAPSAKGGSSAGSGSAVTSAGSGSAVGSGSAITATGSASGSSTSSAAAVAVAPVKPAETVAPVPAPAPPKDVGSLDATASIARVSVDGSLPTSEVESTLERATSALRSCYRAAAQKAQQTPALSLRVSFTIDEGRAAQRIKVTGDTLGLAGCVASTVANLRTRSAPDVGTVAVMAQISFKPIKN